jgi:N-acetyl-anhydromuramyl-L-alanine amidase AmpD
MKRGDKGPQVVKLQEALLALGYTLPRWGADGDLGDETIDALQRALTDHGKKFDDDKNTVSKTEEDFVHTLQKACAKPVIPITSFYDIRKQAGNEHFIRRRTWKEVTGITLHQTACVLGEKPERWANCGAHLGITRQGKVIWIHDFDIAVVHANGFNAQTVGIEMDGTYAGIEGNDRTFWRPPEAPNRKPQSPTPELVEAAKQTVRWIVDEVARHEGKVKVLVAHRQSSGTRQSDPGSALWQAVALPLHAELGLTDGGKGFTVGKGMPIPEAWNPSYKGTPY